jgi:hypothetical protein
MCALIDALRTKMGIEEKVVPPVEKAVPPVEEGSHGDRIGIDTVSKNGHVSPISAKKVVIDDDEGGGDSDTWRETQSPLRVFTKSSNGELNVLATNVNLKEIHESKTRFDRNKKDKIPGRFQPLPLDLSVIKLYIGISGPYNLQSLSNHVQGRGLDHSILEWICRGDLRRYSPSIQIEELLSATSSSSAVPSNGVINSNGDGVTIAKNGTYIYVYICVYIHMYTTYVRIYTYIYTYVYIYRHNFSKEWYSSQFNQIIIITIPSISSISGSITLRIGKTALKGTYFNRLGIPNCGTFSWYVVSMTCMSSVCP